MKSEWTIVRLYLLFIVSASLLMAACNGEDSTDDGYDDTDSVDIYDDGSLNNAQKVVFLVSGASKADALRSVLQRKEAQRELPAQLVRPEDGTVLWLVDETVASRSCLQVNDLN